MREPMQVSLIVFDLGKVIVDLSHREIAAALAETSTEPRYQNPSVLLASVFESEEALTQPFDEGRMTPEAFYEAACRKFHLQVSFDDFSARWNRSFKENPKVTSLIERLSSRYRLFLLSNTNRLHYGHLEKTLPILSKMERKILSYELGHRKPSPLIYQAALQQAQLSPQEIFYVDDIPAFVSAAAWLGIQGVVFQSAEALEEEFLRRGML